MASGSVPVGVSVWEFSLMDADLPDQLGCYPAAQKGASDAPFVPSHPSIWRRVTGRLDMTPNVLRGCDSPRGPLAAAADRNAQVPGARYAGVSLAAASICSGLMSGTVSTVTLPVPLVISETAATDSVSGASMTQ